HGVPIDAPIASAFEAALSQLDAAPTPVHLTHPNSRIRFAGFIGVSKFMAKDLAGVPVSQSLAKLLTYGPKRSAADWAEDQAILAQTRDEVRAIIEQYGFLIMPTVPNAPFAHSEREPAAQADLTCLANIAGLPAISLPMGWTNDGMPLGIQIVGQTGFEAGLFQFARHIDAVLSAYRAPKTHR
ncbi:MAG: amidase family protein, partial [Marinomonas sp.]